VVKKISTLTLGLVMLAGSLAVTEPAQSISAAAVISGLHNKVQAKTALKPVWQFVGVQTPLGYGDSVRTGSASRAEITYSDGTQTRLGSNSLIKINAKPAEKRSNIRLLFGKLWLKVTKGKGLLRVETPTAVASVLGTELLVSNSGKNVSEVTTLDGLVEVTDKLGDKTLVKPGMWVQIEPGKKMGEPTPFDWDALKKNERLMLDPSFVPTEENSGEDSNWK
jgi:ferric-dicitrate binding protein FerR (iron transport regulator)